MPRVLVREMRLLQQLLPPLLLLHLCQPALSSQGTLYDPYGLNDKPDIKASKAPLHQAGQNPNAATDTAYRSYYLILIRNLSRTLHSLHRPSPDDPAAQLALTLNWTVDADALRRLQQMAAEPSVAELQDANALLLGMFAGLRLPGGFAHLGWRPWLRGLLNSPEAADYGVPVAACVIFAAVTWAVLRRFKLRQLCVLTVFISWLFNWVRLYQIALADRQHKIATLQCRQSDAPLGFFESLGLWLSARTSVKPLKDDCQRKLEALLVSPLWDVSPLEAARDLLVNVLGNSFVQVLQAVNKGYRALIDGLPIWHSIILTVVIVLLPSLLLLLRFGYRLRLLFGLLHIGPEGGVDRVPALRAENQRLAAENQRLEAENRRQPRALPGAPLPAEPAPLSRPLSVSGSGDHGGMSAVRAGAEARAQPRRPRRSLSESGIRRDERQ